MTERDVIQAAAEAVIRWEQWPGSGGENYPHATADDIIVAHTKCHREQVRLAHEVLDAAEVLRGGPVASNGRKPKTSGRKSPVKMTEELRRQVRAFYRTHSWRETLAEFGISQGAMYRIVAEKGRKQARFLTPSERKQLAKRYAHGQMTAQDLAKEYDITPRTLMRIVRQYKDAA